MEPVTLIAFAQNAKSISEFVSGNGLGDAITTLVGDIHVDAAKLALETSKVSVNPKDRINSVITHLEAAHAAYARVHGQAGSFIKKSTDWESVRNAINKDVWVCAVMAMCFASLGENQAALNSLTLAEAAYENRSVLDQPVNSRAGTLLQLPMSMVGLLNPRNWNLQDALITRQQFTEFKAVLEQAIS